MLPLVHSNVLFACRGDRVFPALVFDWYLGCLGEAFQAYDFDAIERDLPAVLSKVKERYISLSDLRTDDVEHLGINLVVVGWSEKFRTMRGLVCVGSPFRDFSITPMRTGQIAPKLDTDLRHIQCKDQADYLAVVAKAQTHQVRKENPAFPIGGRLLLSELTRDSMSFRTIADLEVAR